MTRKLCQARHRTALFSSTRLHYQHRALMWFWHKVMLVLRLLPDKVQKA